MSRKGKPITILMADDDVDDRLMVREALMENRIVNELREVGDGEELLHFLRREGSFGAEEAPPRPDLILLDLNMPRKDGREALHEIKSDPDLRLIPIVVLTTSKAEEDIIRSYELGVNSFVTKPVSFSALVDIMSAIGKYWFEIVELPED
jgi:two-component system, response regulator